MNEQLFPVKCPCGNNRWRTVHKGRVWKCRACGMIREKTAKGVSETKFRKE